MRSCYTSGAFTGHSFGVAAPLRSTGARAVAVLPLANRDGPLGFVVLAHSRQLPLTVDDVEALEVLADHLGITLDSGGTASPGCQTS